MKRISRMPLRAIIVMSLLAAISIVAGKYLAIPGGEVMRFSFENLPIIIGGICFGPIGGALIGVVADLLGCVLVGFTVNPLVTLGAAAVGAVSGLWWYCSTKIRIPLAIRTVITVAASHLVGSVLIKTLGLAAYYTIPFEILILWRLLNYLIVGGLESVLIYALLKNPAIAKEINSFSDTGYDIRREKDDESKRKQKKNDGCESQENLDTDTDLMTENERKNDDDLR